MITMPSTDARTSHRAAAVGLLLGYGLDRLLGDPRRGHPVAGFGRLVGRLERALYADARPRGVVFTAIAVGVPMVAGAMAARAVRASTPGTAVLTAAAAWVVLGGRSLARESAAVADRLDRDGLPAARSQVARLVGRDTDTLDASGVARAAVESVAENTSDAVVAPLLWGAVAGVPGLLGYRAVNTLDAMVGHRSTRYERFGWASARLDDVANWAPARVTALIAALAAPGFGESTLPTLRIIARDAGRHPSPNAGVVEAAFAGALAVRLGGRNSYRGVTSDRGTLGDGPAPVGADIGRANRLAAVVGAVALAVAVLVRGVRP